MRFITENLSQAQATVVSASSEQVTFPASNIKHEFRSKQWRSRGSFLVGAACKIDFTNQEGPKTATVQAGRYSVSELKNAIVAALALVSSQSFTVSFSQTTFKWSISSDLSFTLRNQTGENVAQNLLTSLLGFSSGFDCSGSTSYTASRIAIHTDEFVTFDLKTAKPADSVVLLWPKEDGPRLSAEAVIKVEASATANFATTAFSQTLTVSDRFEMASHYFSEAQSYRYWRLSISDPENPYGYVSLGVVVLGESLQIQPPENGFSYEVEDLSNATKTDFGHVYVDEYPTTATLEIDFKYLDYADMIVMHEAFLRTGIKKSVFITLDETEAVFDRDAFALYGKMKSLPISHTIRNITSTSLTFTEVS